MWRVIGHEWAVNLLHRSIATQRLAHTYLFTGPANIGKTHLAKEFAAALNCIGEDIPCGACSPCSRIARGAYPDVGVIEPEGGRIKIDQIRTVQREIALSPYEGRWRVCIITEFQAATVEAANALLKTLEEPPARVIMILTTLDASLLLPTVVSRCQVVPLRAVPRVQIERALVEQWHERKERAQLLARVSAGRLGWAISAVRDPAILGQRQKHLETLLELLKQGFAGKIRAADRLGESENLGEILSLWQTWWRDVFLVRIGCEELIVNLDYLEPCRQMARQYSTTEAGAAIRDIEKARQQLDQNVNPRLALEALFLTWQRDSRT